MSLPKRGPGSILALTMALACCLARTSVRAQDVPHPDGPLEHVFHHICEHSRLGEILRVHEIPGEGAEAPPQKAVCTIGDFPLENGEICFELFAAPEVDDLWLADEATVLQVGVPPTILLRLHRDESQLVVDLPGRDKMILPREYGAEDRLVIRVASGAMDILDARRDMRSILDAPQKLVRGLQLLIPCEGSACEGKTCGLLALDLHLAARDASRWKAAGFANVDRVHE